MLKMQIERRYHMQDGRIKGLVFIVALLVCLFVAGSFGITSTKMESAGKRTSEAAGTAENTEDNNGSENDAARLGSLSSFSAETMDGGTFTQEDIAGKDVTIINFWSISCGPCVSEMPDIASLEKALPENVQLITFCLDGPAEADSAADILSDAGYEGLTLLSADGDLQNICNQIQFIPTTVFAGPDGTLRGDMIIGGQPDLHAVYLEAVNQILEADGKEPISIE